MSLRKPFGGIVAGERFGSLVAGRPERRINEKGHTRWHWHCVCDCGASSLAAACNLKNGHTTSCGCRKRSALAQSRVTHGASRREEGRWPEYKIWTDMKSRCLNEKRPAYTNYGARGITICERWLGSFEAFIADMGRRPSDQHEIDRIDNDGNYEPGNCRWTTRAENVRNRRNSIRLSDDQVRAIRSDGRRQDIIGEQYGLHRHYVSMLKTRKVYSHVD